MAKKTLIKAPKPTDIERLFKAFYEAFGKTYNYSVQFFAEKTKIEKEPPFVIHGRYKEIKKAITEYNSQGYAACLMINAGDGKGRSVENVINVRAFFLDSDGASPELVKLAKIRPTAVIKSSPGRYHVYWFVSDCPLEMFTAIQKAIAKKFGGDPAVCDLPRVMRIAGSVNWKYEKPFVTKLLVCESSRVYTTAEVIAGLEIDVEHPKPATTEPHEVVTPTDANNEAIQSALDYIPADDRHTWLRIGMALHHHYSGSPDGYLIWTNWSSKSAKYEPKDQKIAWDSFKANGSITIGTLFYLAKQHGAPKSVLTTVKQKSFEFTDIGNSERLVDSVLGTIIVVLETGKLYAWNGLRWVNDKHCLHKAAITSVKALAEDVKQCTDETQRDALKEHARKSQHKARIDAMTEFAKKSAELSISTTQLDSDPFLLGVHNGVIDLKTGEFRQALPEDYVTRFTNVTYDSEAQCPQFKKFIKQIMCNDEELILYVQKAFGYTLTGSVIEHCLFFLTGEGRNGKSLLISVFEKLLGDYAISMQPKMLMETTFVNNGPTPELAKLQGKRMVCCPEVGQKQSIDQVLLKQLTGGDRISARPLYSDLIQFDCQFTIWMTGNSKPKASAEDDAFWKRIRLLPFNRRFLGKKDDKHLKDKLMQELPGILNWAIRGCLLWQSDGLKTPEICRVALQEYKDENDSLSQWLEECCVEDANTKIPASIAYDGYMNWCVRARIKFLSKSEFSNVMADRYEKKRRKSGVYYFGINFNSDAMKLLD